MKNKDLIKPGALFILDGSYLLHRSYHAMQALHTSKGVPVQAVFGFCRGIKKIIDLFDPHHFVVIWDSKGGSFRNELYDAYKAHRPASPSDLFEQKAAIIEFLSTIGLASIALPGYEADDIIGTVARKGLAEQTILLCADKDMYQLLSPQVLVGDIFKDTLVTPADFEHQQGFPPSKIPFYYALIGDSSDNIPGVRGIGPKTAQGLVQQFADLDELYASLETLKSARVAGLLREHKEEAYLSLRLFTLATAPVEYALDAFNFDKAGWHNAGPFFARHEFVSLLKTVSKPVELTSANGHPLGALPPVPTPAQTWTAVTVDTPAKLQAMLTDLAAAPLIAVDTETTGLDWLTAELIGLCLCADEARSYYVPLSHRASAPGQYLDKATTLETLRPLLEGATVKKVLHHAKFDQLILAANDITLGGLAFDTMLAANLFKQDWQRVNLKELSLRLLGEPMATYEEIVGKKYKSFAQVPLEIVAQYGALDARQTLRLHTVLQEKLQHEPVLASFLRDIELPFSDVLVHLEQRGIKLDRGAIRALDRQLGEEIAALEERIFAVLPAMQLSIGEPAGINLNSPRQIEELLFDNLKLPVVSKTDSGARSTDQAVLEKLAKIHPVPGMLLKFRELAKLKNTYTEPLQAAVRDQTGRIHTSYSQTMVATGRLSSMNPNLQTIPTSSTYGHAIRRAFVADEGNLLMSADYSQIELRVLAHVTGDANLISAFQQGHDIHRRTAAQIFQLPEEAVTSEQRQLGKTINFSVIYGKTPFGLSQALDIPLAEAKIYIARYFAQYPGVAGWMEQLVADALATGYVSSLWGKRRYVPELQEKNRIKYEAARRAAINAPIQGTAADLMKIAMIAIERELNKAGLRAGILLQIHDEIILEMPEVEAVQVEKIVHAEMTGVARWQVPLEVNIRAGRNWGEITK